MQSRPLCLTLCALASLSLAACKARQPGRVESATIRWTKHHVTIGGNSQANSLKPTPSTIEAGKLVFGYYCVVCHGRDGQNTGVPFAAKMSPPIPSLTSADVQLYSDGQLKWIIEHGIAPSGMPASSGILSDDNMWHIVVYLRNLPPAGTLGDPRAYTGEEYQDPSPPLATN